MYILLRNIEASQIQVIIVWKITDRRLLGAGCAIDALAHPFQSTAVFSESGPQELAVTALTEPVYIKNFWRFILQFVAHVKPVLKIVGHIIAAERQHGEGVITYADIIEDGGGRLGSSRCTHKDAVVPIECFSYQWYDAGTASAENEDIDR